MEDMVVPFTFPVVEVVGGLHVPLDGDAEASALLQVRSLELTSN